MFRPSWSPRALGSALVAVAMLLAGCHDGPTAPRIDTSHGTGKLLVYANLSQSPVTTLVIQVTGPGILKSDLVTPDTLTFNIPLSNGVASGTIAVPAGPQRVITAHAYAGVVETHRGSITTDIAEGSNPTVTITLLPLEGDQPITVSMGTTLVIVRPNVATLAIGDTLRMAADVRDQNGNLLTGVTVHWATLNPGRATIDTAGLLMMRDTGAVQIVATYGTVGGSAMITGTTALSQVAYQLSWNGAVSTDWNDANNWTPHGVGAARVPTLVDSVVVPSGMPNQPVLGCVAGSVKDLAVQAGATLTSSCGYSIDVYGAADIRGNVTATLNLRPGASLAGKTGPVYVYGDTVHLTDSATVSYLQVNGAPAKLMLAGHRLTVTGNIDLYASGLIEMHEGDTLVVYGDVNWSGGNETGLLDGGAVHFRGTNFNGSHFKASGTNTLYLDRTGTTAQSLNGFDFNSATPNGIQALRVTTPGGVSMCSYIQVADTAQFLAGTAAQPITSCGGYTIRTYGPVVTSALTNVSVYLWDLRDTTGTSLVAGAWAPTYTDFWAPYGVVKPGLSYAALRFFASNRLTGPTSATGHVWVEGNGVDLDVNGQKLTAGDYMLFRNFATLTMTHAADSVLVGNYVTFEQDTRAIEGTKLTAGLMQVGSYLSGNGFNATGTHLVRMTGTNPTGHYINGMDYPSRVQGFANLEITGTTPINMCGNVSVAGTLTVRSGATFDSNNCGGTQLRVLGNVVTEAGSSVAVYLVEVRDSSGTANVAGAWTPTYTDYDLAGVPVNPALGYVNLRFFAANKLLGATRATGLLWLDGASVDLDLNGKAMTVGDYLDTRNGATLTMMNAADSLDIANYAAFNANTSAAEDAKLTNGVMRIGSYLYGYGFSASGAHRVVMLGTSGSHYIQGVDYPSRALQGFANLEIGPNATVGMYNAPRVKGTFTVRTGAVVNDWSSTQSAVRVDSDMVVEAGGTIANYEIRLFNAIGTTHVLGTFAPQWTSVFTTMPAGALKPGLGYTNVSINAPVTLADTMTVNGSLSVNGAGTNLVLNGHRVHVLGTLDLNTNATVQMTSPADTMEVEGQAYWDGGGDHTTKLTDGTLILHGDTFCAGNYYGTGNNRTVIDRPAGQVSVQCVGSGGTQLLRKLDVKSGTAALNCWLFVTDTMHVYPGATVNNICSGGNLTVSGVLMTDQGSVMTNGPSYPATNPLTVVLNDSSGTSQVYGSYDAANTYFAALHAKVSPYLHYRYTQIAQSTTLQPGHLTVDGQLDIVNNALVRLGGSTLEVRKVLNFDNTAILQMDQPNDTVLASTADPTGPMFWDGGSDTLLTDGVIRFYGQRFVGTGYDAVRKTNHRFVFADTIGSSGAPATIESSPSFNSVEFAQTRGVQNYYSSPKVYDTLRVRPNVNLSGTAGYGFTVDKSAAGVYADSLSTVSVPLMHLQNAEGTSNVYGTWTVGTTYFESTLPLDMAVKPGLSYQSIELDNGTYYLTGRTPTNGNIGIGNNANLILNGNALTTGPAGWVDMWTGGRLTMTQPTDSLTVGDWYRVQGSAGVSTITDGVTEVRGSSFEVSRDSSAGRLNHVDVLNGQGTGTLTVYTSGGARAFQNLVVRGTRAVNMYYGATVNGVMDIQAPVRVYGSSMNIVGALSTVTGSTLSLANDLHLADVSGTTKVGDSLVVKGTTFFDAAQNQVATGPKIQYTNVQTAGRDTIIGTALTIPGSLTVNGNLTLPTGSSTGSVAVYGTLNFGGAFTSPGNLNVYANGAAYTQGLLSTDYVDFYSIYNSGILDASTASQNGSQYRYKSPGGTFSNAGTYTGPTPMLTHP